ncbi:MAG: hypothetical protein Q7T35_10245 [Nitrosomonas sp.]|nr:hypothetical protein [Nitrosomonas sp.]
MINPNANKIYTISTELWNSYKNHYIFILSFSALVCSAIGFWSEYALLKAFDLDIVIFAEIDDFFLAGLKKPIILIAAFAGFVAGTTCILLLAKKDKNENISDERISLRQAIIGVGLIIIIFMLIISYIEIQRSVNGIVNGIKENPSVMATVQLRNKFTIINQLSQPLVFITATDKFMFFYQHDTKEEISTIVVPISSISYVRYSKFRKEVIDVNSN